MPELYHPLRACSHAEVSKCTDKYQVLPSSLVNILTAQSQKHHSQDVDKPAWKNLIFIGAF
jgi:hypothetical protein